MNSKLLVTLLAAALAMPVMSYAQDKKPMTEKMKEGVKDSVITTKIKADYAKDKDVSAMKIHVETDAKGVQGVTSVNNDIVVGAK